MSFKNGSLYSSTMNFIRKKVNDFKIYWNSTEKNIHRSLTFLMVVAQLFGFFPVQSLFTTNVDLLTFSWFHFKVIVSFCGCLVGVLMSLAHVRYMIVVKEKYEQFDMNGTCFYMCGGTAGLLFILLSKEWPCIIKEWNKIEKSMESTYGWPKNFDKRLRIMSACFLLLEAAEHITIQSHKLIISYNCKGSLMEGFKHFSVNLSFPQVFNMVSYSPWLGLFLQIINSRMAFSWTFMDLFIMIMATSLAVRFIQVTEKIQLIVNCKIESESEWRKLREDYMKLCRLCNLINKKISNIILLSFGTNFYFIIFQLFDDLSIFKTTLESIYFIISFGLLLLRMICVCIYGSWIHEETKRTKNVLLSVQHKQYNIEIDRFIRTVRLEVVGFTGNDYFRITKGLVLKIAGAVVTYELVIIQFNGKTLLDKHISRNSIC